MLFNSWPFLGFLAITFCLYHFIPWPVRSKVFLQIGVLTIASYVFYAWHTPWLVFVLAASTWINAFATLKLLGRDATPEARRAWVVSSVIINLAVLVVFKYASLLVKSFFPESVWSHWGFDFSQIPLPVGISFFTFQGISLVVDVYRSGPEGIEGMRPPRDAGEARGLFVRMAFFKAFFPQLVAGPIVKAHEFMHQIRPKGLGDVDWDDATRKLILGFFLKMVVADNLREATASLSYPAFVGLPGINLLFLLYGFSIQIFADFAGYSLIAMGLARLFGYQLPVNFNFPYLSQSITEFWRRWHISLSTWLREYLYIPLGGNRRGKIRTYINLIIVMLLGGLWHGAAWSYLVWGGAHGLLLACERLFSRSSGAIEPQKGRRGLHAVWVGVRVLVTFHVVTLLWLLFQLADIREVWLFLKALFQWKPGISAQPVFAIVLFSIPVVIYHLIAAFRDTAVDISVARNPRLGRFATDGIYGVLLFLIVVNSGNSGAFIYFQF